MIIAWSFIKKNIYNCREWILSNSKAKNKAQNNINIISLYLLFQVNNFNLLIIKILPIDAEKQQAMNVFLGVFIPSENKPQIWELYSDYLLHQSLARGVRPCHR